MNTSRVFLLCTVFIDEGSGRLYGSERNRNQGLELNFRSTSCVENQIPFNYDGLESIHIKGFIQDYMIKPDKIQKIMCRFICDGKITVVLKNNFKIFISKLEETLIQRLIRCIHSAQPTCDIQPPLTVEVSLTRTSCTTIHLQKKRNTLSSTLMDVPYTCRSTMENKEISLKSISSGLKKRKNDLHNSPPTFSITKVPHDILFWLISVFDVVFEMFSTCRCIYTMICENRTSIRVRAQPLQTTKFLLGKSLTPSFTKFSTTHLIEAVHRSPRIEVLDCSNGVLFQSRHLHDLFLARRPKCLQLLSFSFRSLGKISDVDLSKIFCTQQNLIKLNIINVTCCYCNVLQAFFRPSRLNKKLQGLWLGTIPFHGSVAKPCTSFGDETLNKIIGEYYTSLDSTVKAISTNINFPPLQSLTLANCIFIKQPFCLKNISTTLIELDLRGTSLTDSVGEKLFSTLILLKYVNLSSTLLGDKTLSVLLQKCSLLTIVDLSDMKNLGSTDNNILTSIVTCWPNLTSLSLENNNNFSCLSIRLLIHEHTKLRYLNISKCFHLHEEFFTSSIPRCPYYPPLRIAVKDSSVTSVGLAKRLGCLNICFLDTSEPLFCTPYMFS